MPEPIDVHVFQDGPYKVANAKSITYCGEPIEADGGEVFLCRCGQSKNAPFCDGSHQGAFDGSRDQEATKKIHAWEGKTVRTFFNPNTCMHALYCKPLKELRAKELEGDASAAQEIMKVIGTCPSGALTYETKGASEPAPHTFEADIDIREGGEIRVQRAFSINADRMERMQPERAALCRCGLSKNKPYCDGGHKKAENFR